jgi:O-antigen ligase
MLVEVRDHLRRFDLISWLLVAMVYLPMTMVKHENPMPGFLQEWSATCLALGAGAMIANRWRDQRFALPSSIWVVLVLLPPLVFHLTQGNSPSLTVPLMYLISIGLAIFMMVVGHSLATKGERNLAWQPTWPLADLIATGFFLAALTGAVAGWQWQMSSGLIEPLDWDSTAGLVGQRNHNGLMAWAGVFGLTHLHLAKRVREKYWLAGVVILANQAVYSGSRGVFLYATAGAMLGVWMSRKSEPGLTQRRALWLSIFPVLAFVALLVAHSFFSDTFGTLSRLSGKAVGGDGRLSLWWRAAYTITEHPWLGAGPGSYLEESSRLADITPQHMLTEVPAAHAHNLFLHLGAELGIPFTLMLGLLLAGWAYSALRSQTFGTVWVVVGIPLAVLIHNQIEFSLWYLHFLIPVALCMGAGSTSLRWSIGGKKIVAAGLVGLLIAAKIGNDYLAFQTLFSHRRDTAIEALEKGATHPLFGPWISAAITTNDRQKMGLSIEQRDRHAVRALSVTPMYRSALEARVESLEATGHSGEAERINRLIRKVFGQKKENTSGLASATEKSDGLSGNATNPSPPALDSQSLRGTTSSPAPP